LVCRKQSSPIAIESTCTKNRRCCLNLPRYARKRHELSVRRLRGRRRSNRQAKPSEPQLISMRAIRVAEKIGVGRRLRQCRRGLLHLELLGTRPPWERSTPCRHLLVCIVAQRPVHRAFDVMDTTFFHQFDGAFLDGTMRSEPYQVLDADPGGRFPAPSAPLCRRRAIMMDRDHHAVAKSALARRVSQIATACRAIG